MARFTVAAVGTDRPGIVAAVSAALVAAGCNLEDSSMTILGGQFAILLVLSAPDTATEASVRTSLDPAAQEFGLSVTVQGVLAGAAPAQGSDTADWTVSVYGADHPGIVHAVTRLLADDGVNIVDLSTRVIGPPDAAVYAMTLDVALPEALDPDQLATRLGALSSEIGVDASLHRSQADIL